MLSLLFANQNWVFILVYYFELDYIAFISRCYHLLLYKRGLNIGILKTLSELSLSVLT